MVQKVKGSRPKRVVRWSGREPTAFSDTCWGDLHSDTNRSRCSPGHPGSSAIPRKQDIPAITGIRFRKRHAPGAPSSRHRRRRLPRVPPMPGPVGAGVGGRGRRQPPHRKNENIQDLLGNPAFTFLHYDVTNYLHIQGPADAVLHFASPASPRDYLDHPIKTLKVGSLGTWSHSASPRPSPE